MNNLTEKVRVVICS